MPQPQSAPTGYRDGFPVYHKLNWTGILRLKPYTKWPPPDGYTGHDGVYPSYADMHAWGEQHPDGNLVLRLTDDIIGIDVDNYDGKNGAATLAEAEKRWGTLPPTYRSTSRTDGVSGIRLFRVPPGTVFPGKLEFPELGLGGIEIIQRHHRYVVCWPSHHDKNRDAVYRWLDEANSLAVMDLPPPPADLPDLPQKWIEELRVTNNGADLGSEAYDVNLAFTDGQPSDKVAELLGKTLADLATGSRHDSVLPRVLGLLRHGKNGEAGVKMALIAVRAMFISTVTADRSRTEHEASDEFKRMVYGDRAAKLLGAVVDATNPIAAFFQFGGTAAVAAAAKIDEEAFWNTYDELTSCRDYARSVRVGPLAMLGAALAVAAATIPPDVVLPDIVGDYASANLYVNLVGPSGAIKSQAVTAARAWLRTMSSPDPVKPGSGQGVAKCFAYVKKTKNGPVQVGKRWTAIAMIAEVDTLTAAGSMTGSSLWAELRSAWSDERVGHDYADVTKSVVLQPRRYRLCMIVGVQPLRAGPLFDDVDAGTPQRFVWLPVDDSGAPDQRPGPQPQHKLRSWDSKWVDPTPGIAAFFADEDQKLAGLLDKPVDRSTLRVLKLPAEVTKIVDAVARDKLHSDPGTDPLDGHKFLCQLKVAAALMRLCNRDEVTSKDWELAGIIMAISDRTRGQVKAKLDAEHNRRNLDTAKVSGARKIFETRMAAKAEAEDIARVAEVIVAALTKADAHTLTGAKVNRAAEARDRALVPKALEYLDIDGRVEIEKVVYHGRDGIKVTLLDKTEQTK